jgi:hypothetical protein
MMVEKLIEQLHERVMAAEEKVPIHNRMYRKTYDAGVAAGLREAYNLLETLVVEDFVKRK